MINLENNIDIEKSTFLTHRVYNDNNCQDERAEFQHDRDRIIHSRAFRRLMHKTQIFNANKACK